MNGKLRCNLENNKWGCPSFEMRGSGGGGMLDETAPAPHFSLVFGSQQPLIREDSASQLLK
jgi:hypothetical protein